MPTPRPTVISRWAIALLIVGSIGFVDATYLTVKHYRGGIIPCFVTTQCETVTTSRYSTVVGVPVALLGAIDYFIIIVGSILVLESTSLIWLRRLAWWTGVGFAASVYFVSLQAFVLNAFCFYCLVSAGTSTLLFTFGLLILSRMKKLPPDLDHDPMSS